MLRRSLIKSISGGAVAALVAKREAAAQEKVERAARDQSAEKSGAILMPRSIESSVWMICTLFLLTFTTALPAFANILISVDKKAESYPFFEESKVFNINILRDDQESLSRRFAVSDIDGRIFEHNWINALFSKCASNKIVAAFHCFFKRPENHR